MWQKLDKLLEGKFFWAAVALFAATLLSIALYFQYGRDELPCLLCIHVRIWVAALLLLGLFAALLKQNSHLTLVYVLLFAAISAGMADRSYELLGIERGFTYGVCEQALNFPSWFAIDKWMPWLFDVKTSCGYTPYVIGKISMAEMLSVFSVLMILTSLLMLVDRIRFYIKKS